MSLSPELPLSLDSAEPGHTREVKPDVSQDRLLTLSERLAADMAANWRGGNEVYADEVLRHHPELLHCREAAFRLICEEICLRQEAGFKPARADLTKRFPEWQTEIHRLLDCQELLKTEAATSPVTGGAVLADFVTVAELGKGAGGQVLLARQISLGERPVVLKITPCRGEEHLSLARLQHTHISPLYGVHEDAEKNQRILCMPFFGTVTLHDLLRELVSSRNPDAPGRTAAPYSRRPAPGVAEISGQDILDMLDGAQAKLPIELPTHGPYRPHLARESYTRAVCWVASCLADALQYAHERGLVHLDLKPSNVLLAHDGQPLLLDFHLARPPIRPEGPRPAGIGGTPQYMSPEQRTLLTSLVDRKPILLPVDGRSDIYSLGLILYQLLGGPVPVTVPPRPLEQFNQSVSTGLGDIIHKCLEEHPGARYQEAGALAADLRHHLAFKPLRGVANRDWRERWHKWRVREPRALRSAVLSLLVLIAVPLLAVLLYANYRSRTQHRLDTIAASLREAEKDIDERRFSSALERLKSAFDLARETPDAEWLSGKVQDQLARAERGNTAERLHQLTERIRFHASGTHSKETARDLEQTAGKLWAARNRLLAGFPEDGPAQARQVRADLLDLAVISSAERVRLAPEAEKATSRRAALDVLREAEAALGASPVVLRERYLHCRALGLGAEASAALRQFQERPPRTAWECNALGRSFLQSGEFDRAAELFDQALAIDPHDFWANFDQGLCAYRRSRYVLAVSAFRSALTLQPDNAVCFFNRGLAKSKIPHAEGALADYNQALKLAPDLAEAALNRGILYFEAGQFNEALADLGHALAKGSDPALTYFNIALVQQAQNHRPAALASVRAALRARPDFKEARALERKLAGS